MFDKLHFAIFFFIHTLWWNDDQKVENLGRKKKGKNKV